MSKASMKLLLRDIVGLLKQAAQGWMDDRANSMGAALSYYTVFSVAPLLLIVISLAGIFLGEEAARGAIVAQISDMVGETGAQAIETLVQNVSEPGKGLIGTIVGVLLLLIGATTVFAELQEDLNRIWNVPNVEPPGGLWGWLRARVLSIGLILAIGFLLLASLIVSAAIAALGDWSSAFFGPWETVARAIDVLLSFSIVTTLFALIYRFMPQAHIRWHDVWIGAAVTAFLFTIGKWLIGLYIGKSAVASGFGAAGSLAVLLVWLYYSAQIFLFGAEFTWAYAHRYGSKKTEVSNPAAESMEPASLATAVGTPPVAVAARTEPPPSPVVIPAAAALAREPSSRLADMLARHPLSGLVGMATLGAALTLLASRLFARTDGRRHGRLIHHR
jgi:membrane protein